MARHAEVLLSVHDGAVMFQPHLLRLLDVATTRVEQATATKQTASGASKQTCCMLKLQSLALACSKVPMLFGLRPKRRRKRQSKNARLPTLQVRTLVEVEVPRLPNGIVIADGALAERAKRTRQTLRESLDGWLKLKLLKPLRMRLRQVMGRQRPRLLEAAASRTQTTRASLPLLLLHRQRRG